MSIFLLPSLLFFLIFAVNSSMDKPSYEDERAITQAVAENWQNGREDDATRIVGYPLKTGFFPDNKASCHKRISTFSSGLNNTPNKTIPSLPILEAFPSLPERTHIGWLPGDFFNFNQEFDGTYGEDFRKKLSWGQKKDAFALIYSLNRLYDAGVKRFTLHGQCFGTERCTHALYYLSANEQSSATQDFFLRAHIDRIRKEELLESIESICLQTPLKQASDGVLNVSHSIIEKPLFSTTSFSALTIPLLVRSVLCNENNSQNRATLAGIGVFAIPFVLGLSNYLFSIDKKIVRNAILPYYCTYDASEPDEYTMLERMQYLKNNNHNKSFFMTTAKGDRVVGDKDIPKFFNLFPVADEHKYLVPSPQFGHSRVTEQQVLAKNAFLRQYGGSYYKFSEDKLEEGDATLARAQEGQKDANINEYITYMESEDNYQFS